MWKNLDDFLAADATLELDASGEPSSEEVVIAVLALLLEATHADGSVGTFEVERAVETVASEFDLPHHRVVQLVEIADMLARHTDKVTKLTERISAHLNVPQRVEVMKALWKVIAADSQISKQETALAAHVRQLLGLTLEQAAFARQSSR